MGCSPRNAWLGLKSQFTHPPHSGLPTAQVSPHLSPHLMCPITWCGPPGTQRELSHLDCRHPAPAVSSRNGGGSGRGWKYIPACQPYCQRTPSTCSRRSWQQGEHSWRRSHMASRMGGCEAKRRVPRITQAGLLDLLPLPVPDLDPVPGQCDAVPGCSNHPQLFRLGLHCLVTTHSSR